MMKLPEQGERRQISCQSDVCRGGLRTIVYRSVGDPFNYLRSGDEKLVEGHWLCIYCGEIKQPYELEEPADRVIGV